MKTLTLNNRYILYGMLVVTLGMSKSWLQTANSLDSLDLAQTASEPNQTASQKVTKKVTNGSVIVNGDPVKYEATLTNFIGEKKIEVKDGQWHETNEREKGVRVAFTIDNCSSCAIPEMTLKNLGDLENLTQILDKYVVEAKTKQLKEEEAKLAAKEKEKEERLAKEKAQKALEKAVADCKKNPDGTKLTDLEDRLLCFTKKSIDENPDDDRKQLKAFRKTVVKEFRNALKRHPDHREDLLEALDNIESEVGFESTLLGAELSFLKRGTYAFYDIVDEARNSVIDPRNRAVYMARIDAHAREFDPRFNLPLNRYSPDTRQNTIPQWYDLIRDFAGEAQRNPDIITRNFFKDLEIIWDERRNYDHGGQHGNPVSYERPTHQRVSTQWRTLPQAGTSVNLPAPTRTNYVDPQYQRGGVVTGSRFLNGGVTAPGQR